MLQDRCGQGRRHFWRRTSRSFVAAARKRKELAGVTPMFSPRVPQVFLNVDRERVLKQSMELGAVYQTLQTFMGG